MLKEKSMFVNDKTYPSAQYGKALKEYSLWRSIIARCYDERFRHLRPTYVDCTMSENFKNYTYFYEWCKDQRGFDLPDWELDKDILVKGNKIYSESTCCFVPREINLFFNKMEASRGEYPLGVSYNRVAKKFVAQCSAAGKIQLLGYFSTPEKAAIVYKAFKELWCKQLASDYRLVLDPRVYEAMMVWEV